MAVLLALIFFVLPIAEIAALMAVGDLIGFLPTILALIAFSVAGAVLAKRQGIEIWRRFRRAISQGRIPSGEIVDGMLVLLGGALLLTPGFITDVLGVILLIPTSRSVIKRVAIRASEWWIGRRFGLTGMGWRDRQVVKVASAKRWQGPFRRAGKNGASSKADQSVTPVVLTSQPPAAATSQSAGLERSDAAEVSAEKSGIQQIPEVSPPGEVPGSGIDSTPSDVVELTKARVDAEAEPAQEGSREQVR
jgi:UPF0716 protein FxsA